MVRERVRPYFLLALLLGAGLFSFLTLQPFLTPLILAIIFAVVLQPFYKRVLISMPRYPSFAALITTLLAILCVLVPLSFLTVLIANEAQNAYVSIVAGGGRAALDTVVSFAEVLGIDTAALSGNIDEYARRALEWLIDHTGAVLSSLVSSLVSLFIFFIALYYLIRDGIHLKNQLIALSPLDDSDDVLVFDRLGRAVNSVIRGNLSIAFIQGVLSTIGFAIFGIPSPMLWGVVTAFAALIPGLGTALVFVPAILYLLATGSTVFAIGLAVWGVLAVGMIDNVLGPKLLGSGMQLHPLLVLLAVLGGVSYFGAVGIFLGPLTLALLFALLSIYSDILRGRINS